MFVYQVGFFFLVFTSVYEDEVRDDPELKKLKVRSGKRESSNLSRQ